MPNDALRVKLSEINKKLNGLAIVQKSSAPKEEQEGIKLYFGEIKIMK